MRKETEAVTSVLTNLFQHQVEEFDAEYHAGKWINKDHKLEKIEETIKEGYGMGPLAHSLGGTAGVLLTLQLVDAFIQSIPVEARFLAIPPTLFAIHKSLTRIAKRDLKRFKDANPPVDIDMRDLY